MNYSGGKNNMFFRGLESGKFVFFVNKNTHVFGGRGGNLNGSGGKRNVLFRGLEIMFCWLASIRMYLPEGLAISNCSGGKRNVFFRGGSKFVLFVDETTHVFARGGGNLELPSRHDIVVQRGFASLFCSLARLRMYLPQRVAILNCSGGKRNVLFRRVALMFC